jgi:hypothetical protein
MVVNLPSLAHVVEAVAQRFPPFAEARLVLATYLPHSLAKLAVDANSGALN